MQIDGLLARLQPKEEVKEESQKQPEPAENTEPPKSVKAVDKNPA